jgi:hypothetical protein
MGKPVSDWEKWARRRERDRDRDASADRRRREREDGAERRGQERSNAVVLRALERQQVQNENARERERLRQEREQERALEKRRKAQERAAVEQQKRAQIADWKDEVRVLHEYVERLSHLHDRPFNLPALERGFTQRATRRTYEPAPFVPRSEPAAPRSPAFEPVPFELSSTWQHDAPRYLLAAPAPIAFVTLTSIGGFNVGLVTGLALALAGVVLFFLRRDRVLKPRHEAIEEQRRAQYDADEERRSAEFGTVLAQFRADEVLRQTNFELVEQRNAAAFEENELLRLSTLFACRKGDPEALVVMCSAIFPVDFDLEAPDGFDGASIEDHEVGVSTGPGLVRVFLRCPDSSIIPTKTLEMSPDETKQKVGKLPEKERSAMYTAFVCSYSLAHVEAVFEACPFVDTLSIETFVPAVDGATGASVDNVLVSATYQRSVVRGIKLSRVDPAASLESVGGQVREVSKRAKLVPLSMPSDDILWLDSGAKIASPAFGLVPGQERWQAPNSFRT